MGKVYTGTFNRTSNFKLAKAAPLDDRDVVQTRDDLYNVNWGRFIYNTMLVKVAETNEIWMLLNADAPERIDSWKCIYGESAHEYQIIVDTKGISQLSSAEELTLECSLHKGEHDLSPLVSKWNVERASINSMSDTEWNAYHVGIGATFTLSGSEDLNPQGNNIFTIKAIDQAGQVIAEYIFTLRKDVTLIESLTDETKQALVDIVQEGSMAGHYNYIKNGGFSGEDNANNFTSATLLNELTQPVYSNFNGWTYLNCIVVTNPIFNTGFGCNLQQGGFINQTLPKPLQVGEQVTLVLTAKSNTSTASTLTVQICGYIITLDLTPEFTEYRQTFVVQDGTQVVNITGSGIFSNIALYKGAFRSDFSPQVTESQLDPRNEYLRQTFSDNSSEFPGSAKSDKLIKLGNAGISGGYGNGSELAFWAGTGEIDNALLTANIFRDQPFKDDTSQYCKFLVTQNGYMVALHALAHGQFKGTFNGTLQGNQQLAYRIIFPENFDETSFFDLSKLDSVWWFQEYGNTEFKGDIVLKFPYYMNSTWEDCHQNRLSILSSTGARILIKNNTNKTITVDCGETVEIAPGEFYMFTLLLDTSQGDKTEIRWAYNKLYITL